MLGFRMSPANYQIVVKGELGVRYASAFEGMTISARDGITEITGTITDSAHLQGLLERIAGLGLTLHSVTPLDTAKGGGGRLHPRSDQIRPTMTNREARQSADADSYSYSVADDRLGRAGAHLTGQRWRPHPGTHLTGP